jgi:diacylglycerol kinase (ATP)
MFDMAWSFYLFWLCLLSLFVYIAVSTAEKPNTGRCHDDLRAYVPAHIPYRMVDLVVDNLFLGNECAARDFGLLRRESISVVIAMSAEHEAPRGLPRDIRFESFPLWDDHNGGENIILSRLSQAAWKIDHDLRNGNRVLVHCQMGISRSASGVIAYLLRYQNQRFKTYEQALEHVRQLRPVVRPNRHFEAVLKKHFAHSVEDKEL